MTTVAILSKPDKPLLIEIIGGLVKWLESRGCEVVLDDTSAAYAKGPRVLERDQVATAGPDLAIVLGGDGTILSAARALARHKVPILGVNVGSLGFLTEVTLGEMYKILEVVLAGAVKVDERAMLYCRVMRDDVCVAEYEALNDVVVNTNRIARMGDFDVFVDQEFVSNYKADAVIVSTPTGSTAYSLAAGGPILTPAVDAFAITPVSPHALTNRPLVVRDSAEIVIAIKGTPEQEYVSVDGQVGMPLREGDRVYCRKSQNSVKLVRPPDRSFFEVLRTKLKWGQR